LLFPEIKKEENDFMNDFDAAFALG